jgi:hypothetical protein
MISLDWHFICCVISFDVYLKLHPLTALAQSYATRLVLGMFTRIHWGVFAEYAKSWEGKLSPENIVNKSRQVHQKLLNTMQLKQFGCNIHC